MPLEFVVDSSTSEDEADCAAVEIAASTSSRVKAHTESGLPHAHVDGNRVRCRGGAVSETAHGPVSAADAVASTGGAPSARSSQSDPSPAPSAEQMQRSAAALWDDRGDDLPPEPKPTSVRAVKRRRRTQKAACEEAEKVPKKKKTKRVSRSEIVHALKNRDSESEVRGVSKHDVEKAWKRKQRIPDFSTTTGGGKVDPAESASCREPLPLVDGYSVNVSVNRYLRPYQRQGVLFCAEKAVWDEDAAEGAATGCVLNHDMGLGKTVQIAALFNAYFGKTGNVYVDENVNMDKGWRRAVLKMHTHDAKTALVLCPTTLVKNWRDELERWGKFRVDNVLGKNDQNVLLERVGVLDPIETHPRKRSYGTMLEIVVMPHSAVRAPWFRSVVDDPDFGPFGIIVVDEIHTFANPKTLQTQNLYALKKAQPGAARIGLTGTLMANTIMDEYTQLHWVRSDRSGIDWPRDAFSQKIEKPISAGLKGNATEEERKRSEKAQNMYFNLKRSFVQRKTKAILRDQLPTKERFVVFAKMSPEQCKVYRAILQLPDMRFMMWMYSLSSEEKRKRKADLRVLPESYENNPCLFPGETVLTLVFTVMHRLSDACNHLALLTPSKEERAYHVTGNARGASRIEIEEWERVNRKMLFFDYLKRTFAGDANVLDAIGAGDEGGIDVADAADVGARRALPVADAKRQAAACGKLVVLHSLLKRWADEDGAANVDPASHKIIVFAESVRILKLLARYLERNNVRCLSMTGETKPKERQTIVNDFNRSKIVRVFLLSSGVGATGLNLTSATRVVIFAPAWNPAKDDQSEDRAYRLGQANDVHVYKLITECCIDEYKYVRQCWKKVFGMTGAGARVGFGFAGDPNAGIAGEEFGIKNMLEYTPSGKLNAVRCANARAKGYVVTADRVVEQSAIVVVPDQYRIETDVLGEDNLKIDPQTGAFVLDLDRRNDADDLAGAGEEGPPDAEWEAELESRRRLRLHLGAAAKGKAANRKAGDDAELLQEFLPEVRAILDQDDLTKLLGGTSNVSKTTKTAKKTAADVVADDLVSSSEGVSSGASFSEYDTED